MVFGDRSPSYSGPTIRRPMHDALDLQFANYALDEGSTHSKEAGEFAFSG